MNRKFLSHFLIYTILAVSILATYPSARAQTAPLNIPPMQYRERTMANGLTVLSVENHSSPTVAIQVWYHVGAKNDPEGRSGFAHLFEHIMFKATKNQRAENMDRLTEDVGGENNAYTEADRTVYHETVPSNYLERLLWAEADRMANLSVDQANFLSERAVVEEEFRQSILSRPYGRLEVFVDSNSFTAHPYKRGVIGSIANLDSATLEDVRKFHSAYYRPDNATLIVAGDFDPGQLDAWVDKYFGRIAKPSTEIPRVTITEPARTKETRFVTTGPNVPLPATVIDYLLPPRKSDDSDALRITSVILGSGESSRMNQSLVYHQQVASDVSVDADLRDDAGLFTLTITTAGGKSADDAEKSALAEIDKIKAEPVSAAELEKARNIVLADKLRSRETAEGQAFALGDAAVNYGDASRVNTDIARLQSVTAADVQRVAQKYFTPENRVVIRYENGSEEQGGKSNAPKPLPPGEETAFKPDEQPPGPAAPRAATFPTPVEKTLANGISVIAIAKPGTGLVTVSAQIKAGSVFDSNNSAGLADFTASLLTRGTKKHTAPQIAETVEALGGSIDSSSSWDGASVTLSSLSSKLSDALPIFAEVVRSPAFAAEEIERLRSETLDNLNVGFRSPGTLAILAAARVLFGDGSYGYCAGGTPETIKALAAPQITNFYDDRYLPQNTTLVFGGDITPEAVFEAANQYFGDWRAASSGVSASVPAAESQKGGRVLVIDKPDSGQAAVVMARPTIWRGDASYPLATVANDVLGGGYSSRLNEEVRIKRGLSYGASSHLGLHKNAGLFLASAQTRNDAAAQVATIFKSELARLASAPVETSELVSRKASLSGGYARRLETGHGLVSAVASLTSFDLPLSDLNTYLPQVQSVTAPEVQQFASDHLGVNDANLIIVGDGRQFLDELKKDFPNVEVIPVDKLDLNHASLTKP